MNNLIPLKELFTPIYGVNLELINMKQCDKNDPNSIPFVSRSEINNGISAFVQKINNIKPNPGNTISVAVSGSVLSSFYQKNEYYSGRDLYYLLPKRQMTIQEMLFYTLCIRFNKYKYNYGRAANKTLKNILLPIKIPDNFKKITLHKITKPSYYKLYTKKIDLKTHIWKFYPLTELFKIKGTKTTPIMDLEEYGIGKYPYVTTQATNNSTEKLYNYYTENGNVLTIDSAVLGYCSYQPRQFSASDHVEKLIPKFPMNIYIAMFFVTILNLEQYRYNYGRKCSQTRLQKSKIKLPSKNDGTPDFKFMENFIKSLPYSSSF
jgi:hypothetical protein